MLGSKVVLKKFPEQRLKIGATVCAAESDPDAKLEFSGREKSDSGVPVSGINGVEPFRGKSGSISFCGLTQQSVEEAKLQSAPFNEEKSSFLWVLAPVALISSLILPQFFLANAIEAILGDILLVGI